MGSAYLAGSAVLEDGQSQVSGIITFDEVDDGDSGATDTIDWTKGPKHLSTLTSNVTFTFIAPLDTANLVLKLVQDAGGTNLVTWPSTVKWPGGVAPTLSSGGTDVDIISFYFDGTNYFGQSALDFT